MMRKRKREYYSSLIEQADGDRRKIWDIVNDAVGLKSKPQIQPDLVDQNTVNSFNDYFTNVGPELAKQIHPINNSKPPLQPISNSYVINDIELHEIIAVVKMLHARKAPGIDRFSVKLFKDNIHILAPHLRHIFNHSLETGIYPHQLKTAKLVPIFKEGDKLKPSSYRPISVLSIINTIFEKILSSHIRKYISKYNIIGPSQHGFTPKRSTSTAVLVLSQILNTALHNNNIAVVVYLDIKKAFDAVNHAKLLSKLYNYGFRGRIHDLLTSYLSDRRQCVTIRNFISDPQTVLTGVPQGSVLGPILFSLYINDFPSILEHSQALMYADDTALIFTGATIEEIQPKINHDLRSVLAWFNNNYLSLNLDKTKYTIFHSRRKQLDSNLLSISLNNKQLQHVSSYKYLGIIFESDMHWKSQIQHVCSKLAYGCHILLKARECFDLAILRILYFAFVHSHLSYCLESWGGTYITYLEPVILIQKRALRIMTFSKSIEHSRPLFQLTRILPFTLVYKQKITLTIHNIVQHSDPLPLSIFLSPKANTRAATNNQFNLPVCRNTYGQRLIQFNGVHIWNSIPYNVRNKTNFSLALKQHLISVYK